MGSGVEIDIVLHFFMFAERKELWFPSLQRWEAPQWAEDIQLFILWPYLHLSTGGVTNPIGQNPGYSKGWVSISIGAWVHEVCYMFLNCVLVGQGLSSNLAGSLQWEGVGNPHCVSILSSTNDTELRVMLWHDLLLRHLLEEAIISES